MADAILLVRGTLPWISPTSIQIMHHLAVSSGKFGTAPAFAESLGFSTRFQLAAHLRREGLPSLEQLAMWIAVLTWVTAWEASGQSLCRIALMDVRDPASCYRMVKRLTGLTWLQVVERGTPWVLNELRSQCRVPREYQPALGQGEACRWAAQQSYIGFASSSTRAPEAGPTAG